MKKLICAEDVETLHNEGKQTIFITQQTIITPSAKDLADDYQMKFEIKCAETDNISSDLTNISKEYLVTFLKKLLNQPELISGIKELSFEYEKHTSGLKIVRGSTITCSPVNKLNQKVCYQEIISETDSPFSAGILTIDASQFYEEGPSEAINYLIEGELQVTIDHTTYNVYPGDTVFIPQHTSICWSASNKVTILSVKSKDGEKNKSC